MSITEKNGLKINTKLFDFVNNEIIPGINIKTEEFWNNFGRFWMDRGATLEDLKWILGGMFCFS